MTAGPDSHAVAEALSVLGVDRLVLGVHASAFPPDELDAGYGAPASAAGLRLLDFARAIGFNALQLGPSGQVADDNFSPYDGTVFARSLHSLAPALLCEERLGGLATVDELSALLEREGPAPSRADPARAWRVVSALLDRTHARYTRLAADRPDHPLVQRFAEFRERERAWLELDALYEVMAQRLGRDDPAAFDPGVRALFDRTPDGAERRRSLRAVLGEALERAELGQLLGALQWDEFHARAGERGVALFGDLQVGWSTRDRFLRSEAFAEGWLLGAPPSRTNPEGQPWGYPLLDPDQLDDPHSAARRWLELRLDRELSAHDGLRIDHPHGLVCPWIYRAGAPDPLRAVQQGVRAFGSPDMEDPALQRWAIARIEDLNPAATQRWADDWVLDLDERQEERYARLIDVVMETARQHDRDQDDIAVEVLSTCPRPLARVLDRHGLGRFRVTQKSNPDNPNDVYRTDRARPHDWVMLGNHDTPPILTVVERWLSEGDPLAQARYLARRLHPDAADQERAATRLCATPSALAQALLADLFVSEARHVLIYFTDLLGEREPFNRAGIAHPANWSLRLPAELAHVYGQRVREGRALDVCRALATALRARGVRPDLARALER